METLTIDVDDRLAVVTINRPEVRNALSRQVLADLRDALAELRERDDVGLVAFTGAGEKAFVAGADIAQLRHYDLHTGLDAEMQRTFDAVEAFPKPTVAAVNGFALGGGCELAMACDIRIASENARFGLPETTLSVLPGAGGTQRLARLVGTGRAIEMILTGRFVDAAEAHAIGLITAVVPAEGLRAELRRLADQILAKGPLAVRLAKLVVRAGMDADQRTGQVGRAAGAGAALHDGGQGRGRERVPREAPARLQGGVTWRASTERTRRSVSLIYPTPRSLGSSSSAPERWARRSPWSARSPATTRPSPTSPTTRSTGRDQLQARLDRDVAKGRRTRDDVDAAFARLTFTTDLDAAAAGADLVIEAAVEKLDVKREVFARLDKVAPPHAILTTNSSAIMSSQIADATGRPDRVANMHFFNPALVMRCVEVVRGPATSDATVEAVVALAEPARQAAGRAAQGDPRLRRQPDPRRGARRGDLPAGERASRPSRTSTPPAGPRSATRWARSS